MAGQRLLVAASVQSKVGQRRPLAAESLIQAASHRAPTLSLAGGQSKHLHHSCIEDLWNRI